jgi:hypothetical protein
MAECGCFGPSGPHLSPAQTALLDAALFGLAVFASLDRRKFLSLDRVFRPASRS